jgi:hypothetical protein
MPVVLMDAPESVTDLEWLYVSGQYVPSQHSRFV